MAVKRPEAYSTLSHEARKVLMAHRARIYLAKPDYWFSGLKLV